MMRNRPKGQQLSLLPVKEVEVDGVAMGVLSDGTPYLTIRGLGRLCGVAPSGLITFIGNWGEERLKPRGRRIEDLLDAHGYQRGQLHIPLPDGSHAVPDAACMAILEYYALDKGLPKAQSAYRNLARNTLRAFIYHQVGYDPSKILADSWQNFHDRVLLVNAPDGHFTVFQEINGIVVEAIRGGLQVDPETVPDISVGACWGRHWRESHFDAKYGRRVKHAHNYPHYYPQARSNPQDMWAYPDSALPEFRRWLREDYIPAKYPKYLTGKVKQGKLPEPKAKLLLAAVTTTSSSVQH